jgi:hypothetical protein
MHNFHEVPVVVDGPHAYHKVPEGTLAAQAEAKIEAEGVHHHV